jgi:hypothetical protein
MSIRILAAFAACLFAVGCSQYDINYDYDVEGNFAAYRNYAWIPKTIHEGSTSASTAVQSNTLLDSRIRSAVDTNMAAKGFTVDDVNPDILVVYHTGMQNKVDVTDYGYTYAGSYWGWAGSNVDVYSYTEGTLIVDLVDAKTKKLAWRGSATGVVEPGRSPEKITENINNVVSQIFDNYPPKGNK